MKSKTVKTLRAAALLLGGLATGVAGLYFTFIKPKPEAAGYMVLIGLFAMVVLDQFILLFARDASDVIVELEDLQHKLGIDVMGPEAITALERLCRKPLHHYHMTKNKAGKPIWSYKVIHFSSLSSGGKLTAVASFRPSKGAAPKDHKYQIEASVDRSHLIMKTRRVDGSPDMGIDFFPHFVGRSSHSLFPLFGATVLTTWFNEHGSDQLANSISVLSDVPLVPNADDGLPMENIGTLQSDWEQRSGIARLPIVQSTPSRSV
jgi:hypothetical protein